MANIGELVGRYMGTGINPSTDDCYTFASPKGTSYTYSGFMGGLNLMIDLVTQTGSYPDPSTSLNQFLVQGEKHYWIHPAVDRATGQVIDQQVEEVTE